jgi:hypothetical protein
MKRTKKLDKVILDDTVNRVIQASYREVGTMSVLTIKAVIKRLQSMLKNESKLRPAEPFWMELNYYADEQRKIIEDYVTKEAIKKLNT